MAPKKEVDPLALLAANRRTLRQAGATSQTLQVVETFFRLKRRRPRVGPADVGRVLGIARSLVWHHLARAQAIGLVARLGRTWLLNVVGVLSWASESVLKRAQAVRRAARKRLESLTKSEKRQSCRRHTEVKGLESAETAENLVLLDRASALAALRSTYVPVHLRKVRS